MTLYEHIRSRKTEQPSTQLELVQWADYEMNYTDCVRKKGNRKAFLFNQSIGSRFGDGINENDLTSSYNIFNTKFGISDVTCEGRLK